MSMDIPYPENTYIASYSPKESLYWAPKKLDLSQTKIRRVHCSFFVLCMGKVMRVFYCKITVFLKVKTAVKKAIEYILGWLTRPVQMIE